MSFDQSTKPRVNGGLLQNFHGKQVCLLGTAKNVDSAGNFFTLTACDGQDVQIEMQEPLSQRVSGLTEVHGVVQSKSSVQADNVVVFSVEASQKFDVDMYQKALAMLHRNANFYIQGGTMEV